MVLRDSQHILTEGVDVRAGLLDALVRILVAFPAFSRQDLHDGLASQIGIRDFPEDHGIQGDSTAFASSSDQVLGRVEASASLLFRVIQLTDVGRDVSGHSISLDGLGHHLGEHFSCMGQVVLLPALEHLDLPPVH